MPCSLYVFVRCWRLRERNQLFFAVGCKVLVAGDIMHETRACARRLLSEGRLLWLPSGFRMYCSEYDAAYPINVAQISKAGLRRMVVSSLPTVDVPRRSQESASRS